MNWIGLILILLVAVLISVSACARPQRWTQPQETRLNPPTPAPVVQTAEGIASGGDLEYVSVAEEIDKLFQELETQLQQTDTLADLQ